MSTVFFPRSGFPLVIEVVVERSCKPRLDAVPGLVGAREKICFGVCKRSTEQIMYKHAMIKIPDQRLRKQ